MTRGVVVLLGLLVCLPPLSQRTPVIEVVNLDDGRLLSCLEAGQSLTLSFTHSMYGGEVRETYALGPDRQLWRMGVVTANEAAAEYYATTQSVSREGAGFRLNLPPAPVGEPVVHVGEIGQQRLIVGETTLDLINEVGVNSRVQLGVGSRSGWDALLGQDC